MGLALGRTVGRQAHHVDAAVEAARDQNAQRSVGVPRKSAKYEKKNEKKTLKISPRDESNEFKGAIDQRRRFKIEENDNDGEASKK